MIKKNKPSGMGFLSKFYKEINENGETFYVFDEEEYFAWRQLSKDLPSVNENIKRQLDDPFSQKLKSIISDYIDFRFANKDTKMTEFYLAKSIIPAICDHSVEVDEEMFRTIKSDFEKFSNFFNSLGSLKHQSDAINQGKNDKSVSSTGLKTYTVRDIALRLNYTEESVRKDIRKGKLVPCERRGKNYIFNEETAQQYINSKRRIH